MMESKVCPVCNGTGTELIRAGQYVYGRTCRHSNPRARVVDLQAYRATRAVGQSSPDRTHARRLLSWLFRVGGKTA